MKTTKYTLEADGGKIASALVKMCQADALGETLILNGLSQSSFGLFLARLAAAHVAKGRTAEQIADVFAMLSATNASAAKQALNDCTITFEGEKPQSVGAYWEKKGGGKTVVNLSLLD